MYCETYSILKFLCPCRKVMFFIYRITRKHEESRSLRGLDKKKEKSRSSVPIYIPFARGAAVSLPRAVKAPAWAKDLQAAVFPVATSQVQIVTLACTRRCGVSSFNVSHPNHFSVDTVLNLDHGKSDIQSSSTARFPLVR